MNKRQRNVLIAVAIRRAADWTELEQQSREDIVLADEIVDRVADELEELRLTASFGRER